MPFVAAGVALLALIAAVFIVRRVRGDRRPRVSGKSPARSGDGAVTAPSDGGSETELLIEEIAALDIAFEQGLLDKDVYDRLRSRAKSTLLQ